MPPYPGVNAPLDYTQQTNLPPIGFRPTSSNLMSPRYPSYPPSSAQQQVISQQPGSANERPSNCPPGLEYLTTIDHLLVHQNIEWIEVFTGFETCNRFEIRNALGQTVYYAVEDSDCLTRNLCGRLRRFDLKVLDNYRNEVIRMHRPFACDSCFFPCCLQSMTVTSPPGTVVGTIKQNCTLFYPSFTIKNEFGMPVLKIEGPLCTFSCCNDVDFTVMSIDNKNQIGKISKHWSGLLREAFTDADNFGIAFPMDLDVKVKATLLGACFLIDAMFFENSNNVGVAVMISP